MAFTQALCPSINQALESAFNSKEIMREQTGYLDAITHPLNTSGYEQVHYDNGNGTHVQSVKLTFVPSFATAAFGGTIPSVCDTGEEHAPLEKVVTVTKELGNVAPVLLSNAEMQKLCDPNQAQYRAMVMMALMNGAARSLNIALMGEQDLNWGDFYNSTNAAVTYPILKADGSANWGGFNKVLVDYENINGVSKPLLIGGGNLHNFARISDIGCCNLEGVDIPKGRDEFWFFADKQANATWGANEFALLMPGVAHLVVFNENRGSMAMQQPDLQQGTITDPFRGITYDLTVSWDRCAKAWQIVLGLHYELVFLPTNLFDAGDPMSGANGTLHFIGDQLP